MGFVLPFLSSSRSRRRHVVASGVDKRRSWAEKEANLSEQLEKRLLSGEQLSPTSIQRRIVAASRNGDVESAEKWAGYMKQGGYTLGTPTYTSLLHAYRRACDPEKCLVLLEEMRLDGDLPNEKSSYEAVRARHPAGDPSKIGQKRRLMMTSEIADQLIRGSVEQAEDVIRFMRSAPNREARPDIVTWNVMMSGYSRNGMPEKTLATFGGIIFRRQSEKPTVSTFNAVLQALLNIRQHKSSKSASAQFVVRMMGKLKIRCDVQTATTLIRLVGEIGRNEVVKVERWFSGHQTFKPDLVYYNAIIEAYARCEDLRSCSRTIEEMDVVGIKPDARSFNLMLKVQGTQEDANALLAEMQSRKIDPDIYSYCSLLKREPNNSAKGIARIIQMAMDSGVTVDSRLQSAAIRATKHDVKESELVFRFLASKLGVANLKDASFMAFLYVCGVSGRSDLAVRIVYAMKKAKRVPKPMCYGEFAKGTRESKVPEHKLQPYLFVLKTLCNVTDDFDLPINRVRIKF
ncbi:hypothetical protein NDN08_003296 [Rhodosorus marinus]|uniref:Pentacotripeptide-repeat region of PRORP domain-containing protein n=1 Tax=Rhodosorus marinus TaxID=101924 RepID=A0AAV8UW38_9RHOD|nr:hypothetical protein NDN08_003296 [Rhodosorus marinus]